MDLLLQQITTTYAIHIPDGWIEWTLFFAWTVALIVLISRYYKEEHILEKNPINWVFYILLTIICSSLFSVDAFPLKFHFFPTALQGSSDFYLMVFQAIPWVAAAVFGKPILSVVLAVSGGIVFSGFHGHTVFTILLISTIGFLFNILLRKKNSFLEPYQNHPLILVSLVIIAAIPLFYLERFASAKGGIALRLDAGFHDGWFFYLCRTIELLLAGILAEVLVQKDNKKNKHTSLNATVRLVSKQKKTYHLVGLFYVMLLVLTVLWNGSRAYALEKQRIDMEARLQHINLALTSSFTSNAIRIDQLSKSALLGGTVSEMNTVVRMLFQPIQNVDEFYLFDTHGSLVYAYPATSEEALNISDQEVWIYQDVLTENTILGSFSMAEPANMYMSVLYPVADNEDTVQRVVLARMDIYNNPTLLPISTLLSEYSENGLHLEFVNTQLDTHIPWVEEMDHEQEISEVATTTYVPMGLEGWGTQLTLDKSVFLTVFFEEIYPFFLLTLLSSILVSRFYFYRWAKLEKSLVNLTERFSTSSNSNANVSLQRMNTYPDSVVSLLDVLKQIFQKLELRHQETEMFLDLWHSYDDADTFCGVLEDALRIFAGQDSIYVRLFIESRIGEETTQLYTHAEVENIEDYAYLNEQILALGKEQDQLVVGNANRFHQLTRALGKPFPQAFILKKIPMSQTRSALLFVAYGATQEFSQDFMDDFLGKLDAFTSHLVEIDQLQQWLLEKTILSQLFNDLNFPLFVFINKILLYGNKAANAFLKLDGAEEHTSIGKRVQQNEIYNIMLKNYSQDHSVLTRETNDGMKYEIDILNENHPEIGKITVMLLKDITREKKREEITRDFVTMLSHDLRSPITILQGYSKMLPMVGELNVTQQDYLEKIKSGLETISSLVEGILLEDRIENGIQISSEEFELYEVLSEIKTQLESLANQKRVSIENTGIQPGLTLKGDRILIKQALYNVVNNAVKYSEMDSVVKLSVQTKDDMIQILVQDSGPGIASIDLPLIFEKYYHPKGSGNLYDKQGGMGLYISKFIVEAHRGNISVESELGKGTLFQINLPTINTIN
ncbi:MAG TPA: hypothetical protein DCK95_08750 [Anaerolineaceae bacterium]|uniref:histidine kinase n=1 Tax=Anaerolinea thermophila TaxID=167964 RepID=A0A101FY98_9CHLR|nr:MAG: Putative two-component sensor histidine kinase [Anaerolinea thermophila]HAF62402.1 hypothetical protein [Anaerolineaceae bacterium]